MAAVYLKSSYAEIQLPAMEMGGSEVFGRNQTIEHTYSGKAYVYEHGYPVWQFSIVIKGIDTEAREALYAFFRTQAQGSFYTFDVGLSTDSTLKDWPTIRWIRGCRFSSPKIEFQEVAHGYYDVELRLEKVGTAAGDILRLPSGYTVT